MSIRQHTWAGQKAPTAIDCPCKNNPGSFIGSAIADKTSTAFDCKLAKLATEKWRLDLVNQVRLAKLELADLRRCRMPCSTPTTNSLQRHT